MSDENKTEFSPYGEYSISDKTELTLPKTKIIIEKKDNRFSYYRKNSEDEELRKSLPGNNDILLELVPILPLNLPANKSNDFMFLRLAESVFVEKKSTTNILMQFPIEIGVFIVNSDGTKDFFDCFTCEPMHSRFGMYGTPELGKLCMYGKVSLMEKSEKPEDYFYAKIKATVKNELDKGVTIGKFVFPVTRHNIYYLDGSSRTHIDDISVVVKNGVAKDLLEIDHVKFNQVGEDWKLAPRTNTTETSSQFTMEWGFD